MSSTSCGGLVLRGLFQKAPFSLQAGAEKIMRYDKLLREANKYAAYHPYLASKLRELWEQDMDAKRKAGLPFDEQAPWMPRTYRLNENGGFHTEGQGH